MLTSHNAASKPQKKRKCKVWLNTHGQNGLSVKMIIFSVVVTAGWVVKATLSDVVIVIVTLMGSMDVFMIKNLVVASNLSAPKYSCLILLKL